MATFSQQTPKKTRILYEDQFTYILSLVCLLATPSGPLSHLCQKLTRHHLTPPRPRPWSRCFFFPNLLRNLYNSLKHLWFASLTWSNPWVRFATLTWSDPWVRFALQLVILVESCMWVKGLKAMDVVVAVEWVDLWLGWIGCCWAGWFNWLLLSGLVSIDQYG